MTPSLVTTNKRVGVAPAVVLFGTWCIFTYYALSLGRDERESLLALLNLALCITFPAISALRNGMDGTSPKVWCNVVLGVMFGIHPLFVIGTGRISLPYHFKFNLVPGYLEALSIGTLAIVAVNLGLEIGCWGPFTPSKPPTQLEKGRVSYALTERGIRIAVRIFMPLGILAYIPSVLFNNGALAGGTGGLVSQSAYLYMAPLFLVPCDCLLIAGGILYDRRSYRVTGWLLVLLLSITFFVNGQRLALIGVIAPAVLLLLLLKKRGIPRSALIVGSVAVALLLGSVRDVGSNETFGTSFSRGFSNPGLLLTQTFSLDDTEMVDALSVEVQIVPSSLPYRPGIVVESALGAPVPRFLWPAKPLTADVVLNTAVTGRGVNQASIAYSIVGEFFLDSGVVGVGIGMITVGLFFGLVYRRLRRRVDNNGYIVLVYAIVLPMSIVLLRGVLAYTLAMALFYLAPLATAFLTDRSHARRAGTSLPSPVGRPQTARALSRV